jgi:hypothetical protein
LWVFDFVLEKKGKKGKNELVLSSLSAFFEVDKELLG